jgi:hypothetical protein
MGFPVPEAWQCIGSPRAAVTLERSDNASAEMTTSPSALSPVAALTSSCSEAMAGPGGGTRSGSFTWKNNPEVMAAGWKGHRGGRVPMDQHKKPNRVIPLGSTSPCHVPETEGQTAWPWLLISGGHLMGGGRLAWRRKGRPLPSIRTSMSSRPAPMKTHDAAPQNFHTKSETRLRLRHLPDPLHVSASPP